MWVPKIFLTPVKVRISGPKTAKFGQKYAFLVILGQILAFFAHFVPCLTKKQWQQGALVGFPLISPVKIRIFCPKMAFLFILGQALPAHLVPCWWVGCQLWRAGCISQDTFLLCWAKNPNVYWRFKSFVRSRSWTRLSRRTLAHQEVGGHYGRKSRFLAPLDIPDISGYQLGIRCQFVEAYNNENPVTNQKIH